MRVHRGSGQPSYFCTWKPSSWVAGDTRSGGIRRLLPSVLLHGVRLHSAILWWTPNSSPSICSIALVKIYFPLLYSLVSGIPGMVSFSYIKIKYTLPVLNSNTSNEKTRYFYFYILGAYHGVGCHQISDSLHEPITAPNCTSHLCFFQ